MRALHLVLGAALMAVVTACSDGSGLPVIEPGTRTIADSADQVMFGSHTLITDRGLLRAEVNADTALFFDENTRVEMRIVQGVFFSSMGAKDAVLTSRSGRYNTRLGTLEARGDVVVTSVDGRRLTTPFIRFDQRLNQISSDSAFVLTEPGREVRGVGFVSDPDMQNVRVLRHVSTKAGPVALPDQ